MYSGVLSDNRFITVRFIILFLVLLPVFYLTGFLPDRFIGGMIDFTGFAAAAFLSVLSVPVTYREGLITVSGFTMSINLECTALHYFAIFFAGVLAYPLHGIRYKLLGIISGSVVIFFLNVLRISIVGFVGLYSLSFFDFVHIYLWQSTFALSVFLVWYIWVNGFSILNRSFLRSCIIALVASAAAALFMIFLMEYYVRILAFVADVLFNIAGNIVPIGSEGKDITFIFSGRMYYYSISTDIFDSIVLFAILASAASDIRSLYHVIAKLMLGGLALSGVHLLFISVVGSFFVSGAGDAVFQNVYWVIRGVSIVTPVVIWLLLKRLFRE